MINDICIGMAGSGGDGIVAAGEALLNSAAAAGYHGMLTKSFGPQIRGGESSCRLRISTQPVLNPGSELDVAVALNWDDFLKFGSELPTDARSIVIYEESAKTPDGKLPLKIAPGEAIAVPIAAIARAHGGDRAKNTVVLGLLSAWFGLAPESILAGMRKRLKKKGPEVIAAAEQAFQAGADHARANPLKTARLMAPPAARQGVWLADGNDLTAAAAIVAGCDFFGGYPITPSTEIMQTLSRDIWAYGGSLLQCEDEIAGIGACVGASFGGKRAMTATSGPGMSLKTEMLGLATIAELPLVVVNVQRGGPATGLPTKLEQADLFQACYSGHGDAVRPVLAPTSVADAFRVTVDAFNIAEEFQTPVIVLSDQEISQRKETLEPIDTSTVQLVERRRPTPEDLAGGYKRFKLTPDGISPISHPGLAGGEYLAAGIEHNESGAPASGGANHQRMTEKRIGKFAPLLKRRELFLVEGDADADLGIISWGSSAGICREAVQTVRQEGLKVRILVPYLLYPVAEEIFSDFLKGLTKGLVVEQSYQGQLYRILRSFITVPNGVRPYCRAGANPFRPSEIVAQIRALAQRSVP